MCHCVAIIMIFLRVSLVNIPARSAPPLGGGGINQLSWKIGEENSSSPPKNFIWQWKISPISHISSLLLLNSSQFNSFCNFWEGKTQNFWRYAPILVQIDMSSSPSPHARAKNWGRKHVPSTVGVGKETGSVARILTSAQHNFSTSEMLKFYLAFFSGFLPLRTGRV